MNKKGQIYLVVSLIIGLVIFVLTSKPNIINVTPSEDDFSEISQNFNQESGRFISSRIKEGATSEMISEHFNGFGLTFTQYSKSQNPSFGLIYLLNYNGKLYVGNFLEKHITLTDESWVTPGNEIQIIPGCFEIISVTASYDIFGTGTTLSSGEFNICTKTLDTPLDNNFILKIGEESIDYEINVIDGQAEVVVISRENIFEDRRVFLENQFIKGKKHRDEDD